MITDGGLAMRNANRRVFQRDSSPILVVLKNSTSIVGKSKFIQEFKKCILDYYEASEFEKWAEMIKKFDVQNHTSIKDIYEKKIMGATAHIKSKFFAGLRTTSSVGQCNLNIYYFN